MKTPGELRAVPATAVADAYALYLEVFTWLNAKRVRQWLRAIPLEEFAERQARGELFAWHRGPAMAAIVTLAREKDADWDPIIGAAERWWLKTLAVGRAHAGQDLGAQVLAASERHLAAIGATDVHLECVDTGFLPDYYARFGYTVVHRANITYPSGNTFPVCLMRKPLGPA